MSRALPRSPFKRVVIEGEGGSRCCKMWSIQQRCLCGLLPVVGQAGLPLECLELSVPGVLYLRVTSESAQRSQHSAWLHPDSLEPELRDYTGATRIQAAESAARLG